MLLWAPYLDSRAGKHLGLSPESSQTPGWRDQVLFLDPIPGGSTHLSLGQETTEAALGNRAVLTQVGTPETERGKTKASIPSFPKP